MKKYLIVSDLDGTLLRSDETITQFTKEVLKKLVDQGHIFLPATGRSKKAVRNELLKEVHLPYGGIYHSGASVDLETKQNDFIKNNYWKDEYMFLDDIKKLISKFNLSNISDLHSFNGKITQNTLMTKDHKGDEIKLFNFDKLENEIFEAFFTINNKKFDVENITLQMQNEFGHLFAIRHWKNSRPKYNSCSISLSSINSDKSYALKKVAKYFNVKPENIIFFGDNVNDIEALKFAGIGVAVNNAQNHAKQIANIVLEETNNEDAVAKYIHKHILK